MIKDDWRFFNMKKTEELQVCEPRITEIVATINKKVSYRINQIESEITAGNGMSSFSGHNSMNILLVGDYQDDIKKLLEKMTGLPVKLLEFSKVTDGQKEKLNHEEQLNLFNTEFLDAITRKGIIICEDLDMIDVPFICEYLAPALDMYDAPLSPVHRSPLCALVATCNSGSSVHIHAIRARFNYTLVL